MTVWCRTAKGTAMVFMSSIESLTSTSRYHTSSTCPNSSTSLPSFGFTSPAILTCETPSTSRAPAKIP